MNFKQVFIFDEFDKVRDEVFGFLFKLLPKSRKKLAEKRSGIDKKIAILEYFLLKKILGFKGLPDFEYTASGKPLLRGHNFSISHCENLLCIAVGGKEIGVDVERVRDYNKKISKYLFNNSKIKSLEKSENKNLEFTKLYVQKEAQIKCLAKSLSKVKEINEELNSEFFYYKDFVVCVCY